MFKIYNIYPKISLAPSINTRDTYDGYGQTPTSWSVLRHPPWYIKSDTRHCSSWCVRLHIGAMV